MGNLNQKKGNKMLNKNSKAQKDDIQLAQDILVDEVTKDLHDEQIMNMWKKYKYLIFLSVIVVIAALAGMEGYTSWKRKTRLAESDTYEQASVLSAQGQSAAAMEKYDSLQNGKTNYRYLAKIRQAGILFEEKKDKEALEILNQLRQDEKVPETLRSIAALGYVSHQIETGDVAELQSILNPYLTVGNAWYGTAVEMNVLLLVRENQFDKAKKMIDEALSMSNLPDAVKEHLSVMKKVLEK